MDCFICGKAGLAESANQCPQCNSDLSSFRLLDAIEHKSIALNTDQANQATHNSWYRPAFWLALVSTCCLLVFSIWFYRADSEAFSALTADNEIAQSQLEDQLKRARDSLAHTPRTTGTPGQPSKPQFTYLVKRGDYLTKIAYNVLGDASRYVEIADLNNLTRESIIRPGTELQIQP